jgi:endonuclease/exonuclease/phosphatase family metal-dependent hydrolase
MPNKLRREDQIEEYIDELLSHPDYHELKDLEERIVNASKLDRKSSDTEGIRSQEKEWEDNTGNKKLNTSRFSAKGFLQNKKWLASIGFTGFVGLAIAVFMALIPLKLEMFIQNITQAASAVPGHAIEERTEYIITRALATRLLVKANGEIDGKLAFCGKGGIACSLWLTYTSDYFEKKLGITFEVDGRGRAKLGGKAQSWDIRAKSDDSVDEIIHTITSHKAMKAYIKSDIKNNNKSKNIITRYIGRKILMKKYGVRNFNGPKKLEDTRNAYLNAKSRLKANIISNTLGKVSPRVATYLTCLQGGTTCAEVLRKGFIAGGVDLDMEDPGEKPENPTDEEKKNYDRDKAKYDAATAANDAIRSAEMGELPSSGDGTEVKKFISKKIVTIIGGGVAGVGVLDLIFSAIGAIDDGALEEVWYDIARQTYVGFAYEDIIVMNEKMKAGDMDMATLQAATELFEGAEQSPLQQSENGSLNTSTTSIKRTCSTGDDEEVKTLDPGELVCPDRKVVRKYGESFKNETWWETLSVAAKGWNNTVGAAIDLLGDGVGAVLNAIPGFSEFAKIIGKPLASAMEWITQLMFDPPSLGYDSSGKPMGASNYDALSGGIRVAQNDTMLEGVDVDGSAGGGGGRLLTNQEIATITNNYINDEQDIIAANSPVPAFINPYFKGSLTQQLALMMPSRTSSLLSTTPSRLLGILTPKLATVSASTKIAVNPFGLPIYGYTASDGVFDANPDKYTEESCATSAEKREDSFTHSKKIGISVYTKTDPCALEKMVVGAELVGNGVYDDKYSLKDPLPSSSENGINVMTYNITSSSAKSGAEQRSIYAAKNMEGMDIIGLQEAESSGGSEKNQVKMIKSMLPGYDSETVATRTILWNSKFKLVKSGSFDIPKENTNSGKNPMIWVQLEASSGKRIYAISMHPDVDSESNRKKAGMIVVDLIKNKLNDGSPVIIMGDMNGGDQFATNSGGRATGRDVNKVFLESGILTYTYEAALAKTHADYKSFNGFKKLKREKDGEAVHIDQIYITTAANATVNSWENIINNITSKASDHNPITVNLSIPGINTSDTNSTSASVNTDGYAFPVKLSGLTSGIKVGQKTSTHHSHYDAFDLMSKGNTPVYAITDGEIVKVNRNYTYGSNKLGKPCESLILKSKDGYYYWYGHIVGSTDRKTGIKAGEQIAKVAGKEYGALCHGGGPHLHIDRNKSLSLAGRKGDPNFIPLLSKVYETAGGK